MWWKSKHTFYVQIFFPPERKSCRSRDNVEKYGRNKQDTTDNIIRRMRFTCWITKAPNIHSQYVIFIVFPRQQWLRERPEILSYTYTACVVSNGLLSRDYSGLVTSCFHFDNRLQHRMQQPFCKYNHHLPCTHRQLQIKPISTNIHWTYTFTQTPEHIYLFPEIWYSSAKIFRKCLCENINPVYAQCIWWQCFDII